MALGYITREGGALKFEYVIPKEELATITQSSSIRGTCVVTLDVLQRRALDISLRAHTLGLPDPFPATLFGLIRRDLAFIERTRGVAARNEAITSWPVCLAAEVDSNKKTTRKSEIIAKRTATMVHERLHALVRSQEKAREIKEIPDSYFKRQLERYFPNDVVIELKHHSEARRWSKSGQKLVEEVLARIASVQFLAKMLRSSKSPEDKDMMKLALTNLVNQISPLNSPAVIPIFFVFAAFPENYTDTRLAKIWKPLPSVAQIVRDAFAAFDQDVLAKKVRY